MDIARFPNEISKPEVSDVQVGTLDGCSHETPPKKKAGLASEAPRKAPRRAKGKLEGLLNLPIELLGEITSHLQPFDLLRLARASKSLRSILMSSSARYMWIASRRNIPTFEWHAFPNCPPDLSEPEYASLVFDKGCMGCTSKTCSIDFTYRIKSCGPCLGTLNNRNQEDFVRLCNTSEELTPEISTIYRLIPRIPTSLYFPPDAKRVYNQCMVQKARLNPLKYSEYLNERVGMMDVVQQHGRDLQAWHGANMRDQQKNQHNVAEERRKRIVTKLLNDGWEARDFPQTKDAYLEDFWGNADNHKLWMKIVHRAKPLTDKAWRSIKPQLEGTVAYNKNRRLELEELDRIRWLKLLRRKEIHPFYNRFVEEESTYETWGSYPVAREIEYLPCIDALLGQTDLESPVSADAWLGILDLLRDDIRHYQASCRAHLARHVREHLNLTQTTSKTYIEEDEINTLFLTKDPSRMIFTSDRYSTAGKPFPEALAELRAWKLSHQGNAHHYFTHPGPISVMIEDYGKFELVDNVWT